MSALYTDSPKLRKELQFVLIGRQDPYICQLIRKYALEGAVQNPGQMPHLECLKHLMGADMAFLPVPENDERCIPSKFFEYLRSGLPILALAAPETHDAVQIANSVAPGICLASRAPERIAQHILDLFRNRITMDRRRHTPFRQFERRYLTGRLAGIFDRLCNRSS